MGVYEEMARMADELSAEMAVTRRDLHRYPEMGWTEFRTTAKILERLEALGYTQIHCGREVCGNAARMGVPPAAQLEEAVQRARTEGVAEAQLTAMAGGRTGVIADLDCGDGPLVALRFDMDALGVMEAGDEGHRPVREGFASVHPGIMHACGHDCHVAMGLATAQILMAFRDKLKGTVRLIFQPAEEGCRGAKAIVEAGWLDEARWVMATHMAGGSAEPETAILPGGAEPTGAATMKLDVRFSGKSAHAGAAPQEGDNALMAAATAVLNLYAIPRNSEGYSRVNVGQLKAGTGRNVIPDRAEMAMEVRGENADVNIYMQGYAVQILQHAAAMHGCSVTIEKAGESVAFTSDGPLRQIVADASARMGVSCAPLSQPLANSGSSEDFGAMMQQVQSHGGQAILFYTMSRCAAPFHNSRIDFEEERLAGGVKVFCASVYRLIGKSEDI